MPPLCMSVYRRMSNVTAILEIEIGLTDQGGRPDIPFEFWRKVRHIGRRGDLGLNEDPDLLSFWVAGRDDLVACAERLLKDRFCGQVKVLLLAHVAQLQLAQDKGDETAEQARFTLKAVTYPGAVHLRLEVEEVDDLAQCFHGDLFGFSLLFNQAVMTAFCNSFGLVGHSALRVENFLPDVNFIGRFEMFLLLTPSGADAIESTSSQPTNKNPVISSASRVSVVSAPLEQVESVAEPVSVAVKPVAAPPVPEPRQLDWSYRLYTMFHPVPVFLFLLACYAIFLFFQNGFGAERHLVLDETQIQEIDKLPPTGALGIVEPISSIDETEPEKEAEPKEKPQDSPHILYLSPMTKSSDLPPSDSD